LASNKLVALLVFWFQIFWLLYWYFGTKPIISQNIWSQNTNTATNIFENKIPIIKQKNLNQNNKKRNKII
jgi:hypothetical protein